MIKTSWWHDVKVLEIYYGQMFSAPLATKLEIAQAQLLKCGQNTELLYSTSSCRLHSDREEIISMILIVQEFHCVIVQGIH